QRQRPPQRPLVADVGEPVVVVVAHAAGAAQPPKPADRVRMKTTAEKAATSTAPSTAGAVCVSPDPRIARKARKPFISDAAGSTGQSGPASECSAWTWCRNRPALTSTQPTQATAMTQGRLGAD